MPLHGIWQLSGEQESKTDLSFCFQSIPNVHNCADSRDDDTKPTEVHVDEANESPQNIIQPENTDNTIPSATITPDTEPSDNKQLPSSETSHQGGSAEGISTTRGDSDGAGTSTSSSVDIKPHLNGQSDGDDKILNILCKLDELKLREIGRKGHSTFWPSGWRSKLCTCEECKVRYHWMALGLTHHRDNGGDYHYAPDLCLGVSWNAPIDILIY